MSLKFLPCSCTSAVVTSLRWGRWLSTNPNKTLFLDNRNLLFKKSYFLFHCYGYAEHCRLIATRGSWTVNHPGNSGIYMMNLFLTLFLAVISLKGNQPSKCQRKEAGILKHNGGKTKLGEAHPRGDGEWRWKEGDLWTNGAHCNCRTIKYSW